MFITMLKLYKIVMMFSLYTISCDSCGFFSDFGDILRIIGDCFDVFLSLGPLGIFFFISKQVPAFVFFPNSVS